MFHPRVPCLPRIPLAVTLALALTAVSPSFAESSLNGELLRRADLGFATATVEQRLVVTRLGEDSAAAQAGIAEGDTIVAVDGIDLDSVRSGQESLRALRGGQRVALTVERQGRRHRIVFTPPARPLETIEGVQSHYGSVDMPDGARLRTILTTPHGKSGPMPALFFLQWVSCGSIEHNPASTASTVLATLARQSGMALIRVERSASGDSEGPACHELDYDTELAHYRWAFDQLIRSPHVDPHRIVLYGSSLGSTTAPLLAQSVLQGGGRIAAVVVQGGGAVTYLERMINFDRIYLERRGAVDPQQIHREMMRRIVFQTQYLVEGRSPDEIARDNPAMAAVRADVRGMGEDTHYGRPFSWHQQAARKNFLAAWAAIDAPVLVIFNEFDQFESRHGHRLIADVVNRLRPGTATFVEQPRIGHSNRLYPSIESAYADEHGTAAPQMIAQHILKWLRETVEGAE